MKFQATETIDEVELMQIIERHLQNKYPNATSEFIKFFADGEQVSLDSCEVSLSIKVDNNPVRRDSAREYYSK